MTQKTIGLLCTISLIAGIALFALQYEWIIIRMPEPTNNSSLQQVKTKQHVQLHYWHDHRWNSETEELIWSNSIEENLSILVASWLSMLDAEQIIPKKISLQTAVMLPNKQDAYISLDRNPLPKEWSTLSKWMLMESLLKTIRNNVPIKHITLLVHHQPIRDPHLDFSNPWPVTGFLEN